MTQNADSQPDAASEELDPNSLAAIRTLLASEEPVQAEPAPKPKRSLLSPLAPQAQIDEAPQPHGKHAKTLKVPKLEKSDMIDQIKQKVMGYRPTPKHIVLACLALFVLFLPWLVLGLLILSILVLVGVFLILGYDGFWQRVMGVARWYARRDPSRSAEMHRKLDDFAMRFDAFLDRFPEGSVDGLYLPDFGDLAEAEARHDEALERRLDNLRENEA